MDTTLKTATIFDVDGTLVESSSFDDELYVSAIRDVLGDVNLRKNWSTYRHVSATGILQQIMEENKIREVTRMHEVRARFGELVSKYLQDGGECLQIAGATDLLIRLRNENPGEVGLATGDWGHTAVMKLMHAGFDLKDLVLISADDSEERVTIMQKCLDTLGGSYRRIVYVGDAEWDVRATRELGWHFIGVGKRLKGKCEHWVEDFSQRETFMEMLYGRDK
ncbi:MAG: HAD hydrolase-like protein [Opitutae bacterium]|nr:HAD hydrolase-like protein [Opitutae bacterium]MBC9890000.1 HAD hydrolase-like protein [Opitutae bacterium]